jgi:hypothetical protein
VVTSCSKRGAFSGAGWICCSNHQTDTCGGRTTHTIVLSQLPECLGIMSVWIIQMVCLHKQSRDTLSCNTSNLDTNQPDASTAVPGTSQHLTRHRPPPPIHVLCTAAGSMPVSTHCPDTHTKYAGRLFVTQQHVRRARLPSCG